MRIISVIAVGYRYVTDSGIVVCVDGGSSEDSWGGCQAECTILL